MTSKTKGTVVRDMQHSTLGPMPERPVQQGAIKAQWKNMPRLMILLIKEIQALRMDIQATGANRNGRHKR